MGKKVLLFLAQGFEEYEASVFTDVIEWSRVFGKEPVGVRRNQLSEFGVNVQDKPIVIDGNIITSTGPSTGVDVAFSLLKMLTDTENVDLVKTYMRFT